MIINYEGGRKLDFFQNLYSDAKGKTDVIFEKMRRHMDQYKGSPELDNVDGYYGRAKLVRNITYELVESQNTTYIPTPAVSPKMWSEKNGRAAKSIETMLKGKLEDLPFKKMNDLDERYNPIYGGSVWLIEWDESIVTHSTVGDVRVSCLSPMKFTGQPGIYEIEDMEYCFVKFETTKEDIMRRYGVSLDIAEGAESEEHNEDGTATLYVCYYKNDKDKICEYVWSGDVELLDLDDFFARKRYICNSCGERKGICNCDKPLFELLNQEYEELTRDIVDGNGNVIIPAFSNVIENGRVATEVESRQSLLGDGSPAFLSAPGGIKLPMLEDVAVPKKQKTKLPFYTPTRLPIVIRKNTSEEDSLFGQSDVEFIRPQQQAINIIESRMLEKLVKGGVYPIVPDDFSGELDGTVFETAFRSNSANYNLYGRVDLQADIQQDIAEAERLYDQAKRMLGITDSFQGQYDSSAQSGKAKQLQIQQASGRLDSKRQMKNAAYSEIFRVIFAYYLAYADEPRPASYKDAYGRIQNAAFNRYDFIERDEAGEYYYNDEFLFSADASVAVEKQKEFLWQENRVNFQSGAYGPIESPQAQLIYWLNQEMDGYPHAHDNVIRLQEEIERQAALAQMQQELEAANEEIANHEGYEEYLLGQMKQKLGGK